MSKCLQAPQVSRAVSAEASRKQLSRDKTLTAHVLWMRQAKRLPRTGQSHTVLETSKSMPREERQYIARGNEGEILHVYQLQHLRPLNQP